MLCCSDGWPAFPTVLCIWLHSMAIENLAADDYDPRNVRALFPALGDGYAYLDGAVGTQVPESVIDAIANAYRSGLSNTDGAFPSSRRADHIVAECRQSIADLVGGGSSWRGTGSKHDHLDVSGGLRDGQELEAGRRDSGVPA